MPYRLEFLPAARKEWDRLGSTVRAQFVKKLRERLEQPRVPAAALHGLPDHYKIKLRASGYRLVYRVDDTVVTVAVVAVGKRERSEVYDAVRKRR
jgi:mRNA interferase RelE/StbE